MDRHLEESDTPMLDESHFQGIPEANTTFSIEHTKLCIIFSRAMKRRVALKATETDRVAATKQADEELAEFITQLPQSLQLPPSEPNSWQATLHLSYNNFLILLHRPRPHQEPNQLSTDSAMNLSICSDAAVTINSIFESLRSRNGLCGLWMPSMHVLFTCLLHVATELNSPNPLVAAKSSRMFDSLLHTLRDMSQYWIYAKSLLRLFEERAMWTKRTKSRTQGPEERASPDNNSVDASGFPLGSTPLDDASGIQNSIQIPGGPAYGFNFDFGSGLGSQNAQQGLSYGTGFVGNDLDMNGGNSTEGMNLLPVPSMLEFLLAGVDNQYDF
jgi:transcriptional regulatory protein AMDR